MTKRNPYREPQDRRPTWDASHGSYLTGRAHIDGAEHIGGDMDRKWGVGRLRLLVSPELREKFDRQRYLFAQAIQFGMPDDVRAQSERMVNAWMALDRAAETAGAVPLSPAVWEVAILNGAQEASVVALVRTNAEAAAVFAEGRDVAVFTLAEIGRLLAAMPQVAAVKQHYPGAKVVPAKMDILDPLHTLDEPTGLGTAMLHGDEVPL